MRAGLLTILACVFGILGGCGPDDRPYDRCRLEPTFVVSIRPEAGYVFPNDTQVTFEYGGTRETYAINQARTPKVVFCESRFSPDAASGAGGAAGNLGDSVNDAPRGGESTTDGVREIRCELWTYGSTEVDVQATGFAPLEEHERLLQHQRGGEECTVEKTLIVPLPEPENHPRE